MPTLKQKKEYIQRYQDTINPDLGKGIYSLVRNHCGMAPIRSLPFNSHDASIAIDLNKISEENTLELIYLMVKKRVDGSIMIA